MKMRENDVTATATLHTPIGTLRLAASPRGICGIEFSSRRFGPGIRRNAGRARRNGAAAAASRKHLAAGVRQLREYFQGRRTDFDLPLDLRGTAHQKRVWRGLLEIPFGRTLSYGELARRLGAARAARAVGRACATNPVPVVVPCHRVVGGDGALHGYDGGLWRKRVLLELERPARKQPEAVPAQRPAK